MLGAAGGRRRSKWDARRKAVLLFFAVPILVAGAVLAFVFFYHFQSSGFCHGCDIINCFEWFGAVRRPLAVGPPHAYPLTARFSCSAVHV